MSSPYLCVCDDDHVTCYMGADVWCRWANWYL